MSVGAFSVRDMAIETAEPEDAAQWCPLCDRVRTALCDAELASLAVLLPVDELHTGRDRVADVSAVRRWTRLREQVADLPPATHRRWAAELADAGPAEIAMALEQVDAERLDAYSAVVLLQACQALESFVAVATARAVVAVGGASPPADEPSDASACAEIAAATRRTSFAAGRLLDRSRGLCRLPATTAALESGAVTTAHAAAIVEAVADLDDAAAAWVEDQVLPVARRTTVGRTRTAATRAAFAAEPALAAARAERAHAERRVERWRTPGSAEASLLLSGPPQDIETIWSALDGEARTSPDGATDPRSMDARRFDVALGWATGREVRPDGSPPPRTVGVQLTVDLATLLGLSESPGELAGYGPIPAPVARRLAGEDGAWWQRFVHDPVTGYLLDLGDERYRPSAALRRFVVARDRTSRFPGSSVPAQRCDLDHAVRFPDGPTAAANLQAVNRTGHEGKTRGHWSVELEDGGEGRWTGPSGHHWVTTPHDYRPQRARGRSDDAGAGTADGGPAADRDDEPP